MHNIHNPTHPIVLQYITSVQQRVRAETAVANMPYAHPASPGAEASAQHHEHDEGVPDLASCSGGRNIGAVGLHVGAVDPDTAVEQDGEEDGCQGGCEGEC